jgi:hypothetical protein
MYSCGVHVTVTFTHLRGSRLPPNRSHPRGSLEGELLTYMQSTPPMATQIPPGVATANSPT